jgi:hypothetical protein
MRRLFKILLMLVINLAMPLQGMAAATLFHCEVPPAGAASAAGALDHSQLRQAGHQHVHDVDGLHGRAASDHHDAAGPAAGDDAADGAQTPASKCSACGSCCTGAALPSAPIVLAAPEFALAFDTPVASRSAPFVTHGPERPPRLFLA